jgi:hypothetical protein
MLEVEGKTFHKFVEIKNYRTSLYLNYCDINQKDRHVLGLYVETKNKGKFFSDAQFHTEDDFVKHFFIFLIMLIITVSFHVFYFK